MSNAALLILTLGVCEREGTSARRNSKPFFIVPRRFCSALKEKIFQGAKESWSTWKACCPRAQLRWRSLLWRWVEARSQAVEEGQEAEKRLLCFSPQDAEKCGSSLSPASAGLSLPFASGWRSSSAAGWLDRPLKVGEARRVAWSRQEKASAPPCQASPPDQVSGGCLWSRWPAAGWQKLKPGCSSSPLVGGRLGVARCGLVSPP